MLGFPVSKEHLKVFLEELDEKLEALEQHLLTLEKSPSSSVIQEIFRAAHTVKGSSASIGHEPMAKLTHAMESVLDSVRQERLQVNREMIDLLFRSLDILKVFQRDLKEGKKSQLDAMPVEEALESLAAQGNLNRALSGKALSDSVHRSGDEKLYEIKVHFTPDCEMRAVRAFQVVVLLKEVGEIVQSTPSIKEIEKGEINITDFLIRLKTGAEVLKIQKAVEQVPELSDIRIQELQAEGKADEIPSQGPDIATEVKGIHTIRVNVDLLDNLMNLVGELVFNKTRFLKIGSDLQMWGGAGPFEEVVLETTHQLSKITADLQEEVMKARLVSVDLIFSKLPRIIRDLSKRRGKEVECVIEGSDTQLDRSVLEAMSDPLIHLVRNAVDHGLETPEERRQAGKNPQGTIKISAYHRENHVIIALADDGRGIALEKIKKRALEKGLIRQESLSAMSSADLVNLIFLPGFSTADEITDLSGRGVGMDIVKASLQKISGGIEIETQAGKGTTFFVRIPLTLAILHGLQVDYRGATFVIPLSAITEIVKVLPSQVKTVSSREVFQLRGQVVPLIWLGEFFQEPFPRGKEIFRVVVVFYGDKQAGIVVDNFFGNQEVVVKNMGPYVGELPGIAGATVLGDGTVALVLDIPSFLLLVNQTRLSAAR